MLILLNTPAPPAQPAIAHCGPPAPAWKGGRTPSASFSVEKASRAALREMPGAVVVVEEDGPAPLAKQGAGASFLRGRLRLLTRKDLPVFPATTPMPRWMDPTVTMSGGNVVGQTFAIGYGY